jgi:uncharacterized paraquat-inducible protein A
MAHQAIKIRLYPNSQQEKGLRQNCGCCGVIDKKSRRSQSEFKCVHCGHKLNADKNAALNILVA